MSFSTNTNLSPYHSSVMNNPFIPLSSQDSQVHDHLMNEYHRQYSSSPIYNPLSFRQAQDQSPYAFAIPTGSPIFDHNNLSTLKCYLTSCLQGFNPCQFAHSHPIHNELVQICTKLLDHCKESQLEEKITYLNKAIAEIIHNCSQIKTLYFDHFGRLELLEIALRNHLSFGLLQQEKVTIESFYHFNNKKFPNNLYQREAALHHFATKNNFYVSPNSNMIPILYQNLIEMVLPSCVAQASDTLPLSSAKNETFIQNQLKNAQLSTTSQCSWAFEANLRDRIARKLVTKLAAQYRKEFHETGKINQDQLRKDSESLLQFASASGKFPTTLHATRQLIGEAFELPYGGDLDPFASVRTKILQEQDNLSVQPAPDKTMYSKFKSWTSHPSTSSRTIAEQRQALVGKKMDTIEQVEKIWNATIAPTVPVPIIPSAPLVEKSTENLPHVTQIYPVLTDTHPLPLPLSPPVENHPIIPPPAVPVHVQTLKYSADERDIPVVSYVDISFKELLNRGADQEIWNSLPMINQKDVLRHVHYYPGLKGKAEEVALRIFQNDGWKLSQTVTTLNRQSIPAPVTGLNESFVSVGQELIDFYYSDKILGQFLHFTTRFKELPKEPRFYQYVYEMALAANVHIESWDHHFAENNWDKPGMLHLSVQALERCLHTTP